MNFNLGQFNQITFISRTIHVLTTPFALFPPSTVLERFPHQNSVCIRSSVGLTVTRQSVSAETVTSSDTLMDMVNITNMATVRNFEVKSDDCYVVEIILMQSVHGDCSLKMNSS
jgi:hypothetical protein